MPSLTKLKRKLQGSRNHEGEYGRLDLRSMSAYSSYWGDCQFTECRLGLSDLNRAEVERTVFRDCSAPMLNLTGATLRDVMFIDCDLEQASFAGAVLHGVSFLDSRMTYATFAGATIRAASFLRANLHGADLRFIETNSVSFEGSNLWGVSVTMNCQFWNGVFDEKQGKFMAALAARIQRDKSVRSMLEGAAGAVATRAVERLMRDEDDVNDES